MRTPTRRATALAAAVVTGLVGTLASGCAGATKSAQGPVTGAGSAAEVLASSYEAMGELRSMRVEGRFWE